MARKSREGAEPTQIKQNSIKSETKKDHSGESNGSSVKKSNKSTSNQPPTSKGKKPGEKSQSTPAFVHDDDKIALQRINVGIDKAQAEIKLINEQITTEETKRKEIYGNLKGAEKKLERSKSKSQSLVQDKNQVLEQIKQDQHQREVKLKETAKLKAQIDLQWTLKQPFHATNEYSNVDKIKAKVKNIEQTLESTALPMSEEKKLVAQTNTLNQLIAVVQDYHRQLRDANSNKNQTFLESRVAGIDKLLKSNEEFEETVAKEVEELQKNLDESKAAIKAKVDRRKALNAEIKDFYSELQKVRSKIDVQKAEWVEQQEERRQKEKEAREQKLKEQEEARLKEEKQRETKERRQAPYKEELTNCDKLTKGLQQLKEKPEKEPKKGAPAQDTGFRVAIDLLILFEALSIVPPSKLEDIDASIKEVGERKAWFLQQQKEVPKEFVPETETVEKENEEEEDHKEKDEQSTATDDNTPAEQ